MAITLLPGRARVVGLLAGVLARRQDDDSGRRRGRRPAASGDRRGCSKLIRTIQRIGSRVRALGVSLDGKLLATGGNDRAVRLWHAASGWSPASWPDTAIDVYSLAFHPDGQTLLSGDLLGSIRQWDIASGKRIGAFACEGPASAPLLYGDSRLISWWSAGRRSRADGAPPSRAGGLHKATNPLGAVRRQLIAKSSTPRAAS